MSAYTRFGSAPDTVTPIRPSGPAGRPLPSSRFHVLPASVDLYNPLPGPPLLRLQGVRYASHIAANSVLGLVGSKTTSMPPVLSLTNSTRCQVAPPSVVRKMPRSVLGP